MVLHRKVGKAESKFQTREELNGMSKKELKALIKKLQLRAHSPGRPRTGATLSGPGQSLHR